MSLHAWAEINLGFATQSANVRDIIFFPRAYLISCKLKFYKTHERTGAFSFFSVFKRVYM